VFLRVAAVFGFAGILLIAVLNRALTTVYKFPSPDGSATVELRERSQLADSTLELLLRDGWLRSRKLAPVRNDCWLSFAHAAWTTDSTRVAVYFGDPLCGNTWVAYDRQKNQFLPFETPGAVMHESLRETYNLSPQQLARSRGDPLLWMQGRGRGRENDDPAASLFRARLHP